MAVPFQSDLATAFRAYLGVLEGLAFPTSAEKLFPNDGRHSAADPAAKVSAVQLVLFGEEPKRVNLWPQALVRVGGFRIDGGNNSRRVELDFVLEVRKNCQGKVDGESAYLGANRQNTDGNQGAGLADILEVLLQSAAHISTPDATNAQNYFELLNGEPPDFGGSPDFAFLRLNGRASIKVG